MAEAKVSAVTLLVLVASLVGNIFLLSQMFVGRQEYLAELRNINRRLARIESRLWPSPDPPTAEPQGSRSEG